jgi:hypothetical protein
MLNMYADAVGHELDNHNNNREYIMRRLQKGTAANNNIGVRKLR